MALGVPILKHFRVSVLIDILLLSQTEKYTCDKCFKEGGYTSMFTLPVFTKGNNHCDFLLFSLATKPF